MIGGLYHLVAAAGHTLGWECGGTARAHGGVVVSAAFSGAPPSVTIRNRGRGGAFKVTTSLQASCAGGQLKVVNANVAALAPTDEPIPVASNAAAKYQEVSGAISYQDIEGTRHWSRCGEKSPYWEFEEGPAPVE